MMVSARNGLLPVSPHSRPLPPIPEPPAPAVSSDVKAAPSKESGRSSGEESGSASDHEQVNSDAGSEADVESNAGDPVGVEGSWISLNSRLQSAGGGT